MSADRPVRLLWMGTYERDYSRTRVLMAGLRELGVEVLEAHRPLWERTRHKAGTFLSPTRAPLVVGQMLTAWAAVAREQRRLGPVDAVVAGYPHQPDALPAWLIARARGVPLIVDAMISLWDTLAGDRARVGPTVGRGLAALDTVTLRCADLVIADTEEHARFFSSRFGIDPSRIGVARVGAEPGVFREAPAPDGPPRALFYGKLSPLHGLETVIDAARRPGTPPLRLIGDGQLGGWLRDQIGRDRPAGFEHVPWVEFPRLGDEIAAAAVCLGVFGRSAKASRVVPNKVYHAMAVGRPIVTADTPAAREVLEHGRNALLVSAGDADALADALTRLAADRELRARLGDAARERFHEVGSPRVVATQLVSALERAGVGRRRGAAPAPGDG